MSQRSPLLDALLSPEVIRRSVSEIFHPIRPVPKETERTSCPVPKLPRPRSERPYQAKPVPKPRLAIMADYSTIAGFHLKFSVHPNQQYAHAQMNSIYGDLFTDHTDFYTDPVAQTGIAADIMRDA